MVKRTNTQAAGRSAAKKAKTDPALVSIADVIMQADHLPDRCRAMLVDMLPFSLSVPSDQRHEAQTWAVDAVEQTLSGKKSELEAAAAAEELKLSNLTASEAGLAGTVTEAETALAAQNDVVKGAEQALADATAAAKGAGETLAVKRTEQQAGAAKLTVTQDEKAKLEAAFEAHFKVPMQEGTGPHFKELQPFLKQIEMEASLMKAMPSSCGKSKEDRGSFDEIVLQELEKALSSKVASLGEIVAVETPACVEREAAVQAAEKDHSDKEAARKQAVDVHVAGQKEQSDREAVLAAAKLAVQEFLPQVETMSGLVDEAKVACANFESGALLNFTNYKSRVAVPAEAGVAGA